MHTCVEIFFDQIHFKFLPLLFISLIFTYVFYSFFSHSVIRLRELEDKAIILYCKSDDAEVEVLTPLKYTFWKSNAEFLYSVNAGPRFNFAPYVWTFTVEYLIKMKRVDPDLTPYERSDKYLDPIIDLVNFILSPMYFFYDVKWTCSITYSKFWNIIISGLFATSWGYIAYKTIFV